MSSASGKVTKFQKYLVTIDAHWTARDWAGERSAKQAWEESPYADLLLLWSVTAGVEHKLIVRCACRCARSVLHLVKAGELEPLKAIETTEAWCDGRAAIEDVDAARQAIWNAREIDRGPEGGPLTAADRAAYAATWAACAAYYPAYANNVAVDAGYALALARLEATAPGDGHEQKAERGIAAVLEINGLSDCELHHQKAMCAIVREMIPFPGMRNVRSRPATLQQQ